MIPQIYKEREIEIDSLHYLKFENEHANIHSITYISITNKIRNSIFDYIQCSQLYYIDLKEMNQFSLAPINKSQFIEPVSFYPDK